MHAWIRFNTQLQTKGFRCQGWRSKLQNYKSNDKTKSGIRTQIHIWIQLSNFIYKKVIFMSKITKLSVKWKSHLPYFSFGTRSSRFFSYLDFFTLYIFSEIFLYYWHLTGFRNWTEAKRCFYMLGSQLFLSWLFYSDRSPLVPKLRKPVKCQ
jgi:hypothetical protein